MLLLGYTPDVHMDDSQKKMTNIKQREEEGKTKTEEVLIKGR